MLQHNRQTSQHAPDVYKRQMLEQIGTPGGGFGFSYHYSNGGNPTRVGGVLPEMSAAIAGQASEAAEDVYKRQPFSKRWRNMRPSKAIRMN